MYIRWALMYEFRDNVPSEDSAYFTGTNESTDQDSETERSGLHLCSLINQMSSSHSPALLEAESSGSFCLRW